MTAKQRRFERTVIGYLERIERKVDAVCKAAGLDPDTLIDLSMLETIEDNAAGDNGFDASGEELEPETPADVVDDVLAEIQADKQVKEPAPPEPKPSTSKPGSSKPKAS